MSLCFHKCANLWCFLVVFCLCYFLETITFTYLISAVQSVERQFQIPSSKSGTLIAASDIGYVLTVVVLAYVGSKGNRARWIGGGCVLISLACFLASMPNFIFPNNQERIYSHDFVVQALVPKLEDTTWANVSADPFLTEKFIQFRKFKDTTGKPDLGMSATPKFFITEPVTVERRFFTTSPLHQPSTAKVTTERLTTLPPTTKATTQPPVPTIKHIDEDDLDEGSGIITLEDLEEGDVDEHVPPDISRIVKRDIRQPLVPLETFLTFVNRTLPDNVTNLLKIGSNLPFMFCNTAVNKLKKYMTSEKCKEQQTNNVAYGIVFVAISFIGVGHSMPWTLGMPLIDDNVSKKNTPFFFGNDEIVSF